MSDTDKTAGSRLHKATCSADWFLAGWQRALRVPSGMYPRLAAERIPIRHRIAVRRKIELLQCDNCGEKAEYYASHEEAGAVKICDGCRRSHWQEHSNVRAILPNDEHIDRHE